MAAISASRPLSCPATMAATSCVGCSICTRLCFRDARRQRRPSALSPRSGCSERVSRYCRSIHSPPLAQYRSPLFAKGRAYVVVIRNRCAPPGRVSVQPGRSCWCVDDASEDERVHRDVAVS
ncbi:hypothetical protein MRB53_041339 [Persea americana]|nr:hypothetical protein MRB53_041339 [Persea americana]